MLSKPEAELDAREDDSGEEEDESGVAGVSIAEVPDAEEDESDEEVQQAPESVDEGRGQSFAGRSGEGRGE